MFAFSLKTFEKKSVCSQKTWLCLTNQMTPVKALVAFIKLQITICSVKKDVFFVVTCLLNTCIASSDCYKDLLILRCPLFAALL